MPTFSFAALTSQQQRLLQEATWDKTTASDGTVTHTATFNGRDGDAISSVPKAVETGDGVTIALSEANKGQITGRAHISAQKTSVHGDNDCPEQVRS